MEKATSVCLVTLCELSRDFFAVQTMLVKEWKKTKYSDYFVSNCLIFGFQCSLRGTIIQLRWLYLYLNSRGKK